METITIVLLAICAEHIHIGRQQVRLGCRMAEEAEEIPLKTKQTQIVATPLDKKAKRIIINVSGSRFITTIATLQRFPNTRLGELLEDGSIHSGEEIFFDADDDIFREVLRYHRTGELHTPSNMCQQTFTKQLKYWGVDTQVMEECCQDTDMTEEELEEQFLWFEKRIEPKGDMLTCCEGIWYFLTDPQGPYTKHWKMATAFTVLYMAVTVSQLLNLAVYTLSSLTSSTPEQANETVVDQFTNGFRHPCQQLEIDLDNPKYNSSWLFQEICFIFFFIEIILRILCCPIKKQIFTSIHLLDFIVILVELAGCIMVRGLLFTAARPDSEPICMFVNVYILLVVLVINFRGIRLLAFATVFR